MAQSTRPLHPERLTTAVCLGYPAPIYFYQSAQLSLAAARWGFSRWRFNDLMENLSFWGSGRLPGALEPSKKVGGEASHLFEGSKAPRRRPDSQNERFSIKSLNPHRLNPHRAAADNHCAAQKHHPWINANATTSPSNPHANNHNKSLNIRPSANLGRHVIPKLRTCYA